MSSQLVDINADGFNDILCGSFSGTPQIVMGSSEGFEKPKDLLDSAGELILIERFWNREDRKWDATDRCESKGLCTSSSLVDWDDDGDFDLILGGYRTGHLFLRLNEGTRTEPQFATTNVPIKAGSRALDVPKGLAAPCVVDWNGDGLFDLLCGGSKGGVYYFENKGAKGNPKFAKGIELISPLPSVKSQVVVQANGDMPAMPGTSWHIDPVDYDGDGDLDLLVGGRSTWLAGNAEELTNEEQERLVDLEEEVKQARLQLVEFTREQNSKEIGELVKSDEYQAILSDYTEARKKKNAITKKLSPKKSGDFVWVFRRK